MSDEWARTRTIYGLGGPEGAHAGNGEIASLRELARALARTPDAQAWRQRVTQEPDGTETRGWWEPLTLEEEQTVAIFLLSLTAARLAGFMERLRG